MLKKLLAFFEAVLVVFLVILVIAIFTFRLSFSKENSLPTIFGHSFFILNSDDMQNDEGTGINKGALIVASNAEIGDIKEGMVVLCDTNDIQDAEPDYDVLRIYAIEPNNEMTTYTVSNEAMASNRTYIIGKDKIVAKCKYSSDLLGQIIAFSRTSQGILTLIIIPCVVLIALQIVHIVARARRNRFERVELETFEFPSDMTFPDDEQSPLYDPNKADYTQKTDVEEFFANKNEAMSKSSKHKVKNSDNSTEPSRNSSKKNKSAMTENTDDGKPAEQKSSAVTKKKSVKDKETAIAEEAVQDKGVSAAAPVNTDENSENSADAAQASDNIKRNDMPEQKAQSDVADVAENIDKKPDTELSQSDLSILTKQEAVQEIPTADDSKTAQKQEAAEVIQLHEDMDEAASGLTETAVSEINVSDDSEKETPIVKENAADTQKKTSTAAPVKKKTTVKKRATVKKGPSASAADLLKAIDTESKKLK